MRTRSPRSKVSSPDPEQRAAASSTDLFLLNASRLYQQVIGLVKRHPLLGQEQRGMQVSHRWTPPPPHPALTTSREDRRKTPSSSYGLSQYLPTWAWHSPRHGLPIVCRCESDLQTCQMSRAGLAVIEVSK